MSTKKTFVIFGGYGSVGTALAQTLAAQGHNLLLCGRESRKLALVADSLQANFYCADCTRFNEVEDCIEAAKEAFGKVDGVAHCVSSVSLKPAHLIVEREWSEVINTNLTSAFACLKYAVKAMRQNGGSIVFTTSAAACTGLPNQEAVSAARAGILGLTTSAAATYAANKIRINAVSAQDTDTVFDIARVMGHLLTDESTWISGQIIAVTQDELALK